MLASVVDNFIRLMYKYDLRGRTRVYQALRGGRPLTLKTKDGLLVALFPGEYIDAVVIREGYYESEVASALLNASKAGDVLWDIGANWGLHALTVKMLRPGVDVSAFEPNPPLFEKMTAAAAANKLDINGLEIALGPRRGEATLYVHDGNAGMSSLVNWHGQPSSAARQVRMDSGDQVAASGRAPPPTVIKLDVEGYEAEVLSGMDEILARPGLHTIVFEDNKGMDTAAKLFLRQKGFRIDRLVRREATEHALANFVATRPPG